jgi:hypothetical protein
MLVRDVTFCRLASHPWCSAALQSFRNIGNSSHGHDITSHRTIISTPRWYPQILHSVMYLFLHTSFLCSKSLFVLHKFPLNHLHNVTHQKRQWKFFPKLHGAILLSLLFKKVALLYRCCSLLPCSQLPTSYLYSEPEPSMYFNIILLYTPSSN